MKWRLSVFLWKTAAFVAKNSWKEFNNQTHCGFKYYRQSFHQSLGEILTEFPENQLNKMLMNVLLQSPAKIKWRHCCIGSANHRCCVCSTLPHFESYHHHITCQEEVRKMQVWQQHQDISQQPLCHDNTYNKTKHDLFFFLSSTALSQFEYICSLQKCTMQHLFRGSGSNITWTLDAPSFRFTLGGPRARVSFHENL